MAGAFLKCRAAPSPVAHVMAVNCDSWRLLRAMARALPAAPATGITFPARKSAPETALLPSFSCYDRSFGDTTIEATLSLRTRASTTVLAAQHKSPHRSFNPHRDPLTPALMPSYLPTIFLLTRCTTSARHCESIPSHQAGSHHAEPASQHPRLPSGAATRSLAEVAPLAHKTPAPPSFLPVLFPAPLENYQEKA